MFHFSDWDLFYCFTDELYLVVHLDLNLFAIEGSYLSEKLELRMCLSCQNDSTSLFELSVVLELAHFLEFSSFLELLLLVLSLEYVFLNSLISLSSSVILKLSVSGKIRFFDFFSLYLESCSKPDLNGWQWV